MQTLATNNSGAQRKHTFRIQFHSNPLRSEAVRAGEAHPKTPSEARPKWWPMFPRTKGMDEEPKQAKEDEGEETWEERLWRR